jgi:hypothetical protein
MHAASYLFASPEDCICYVGAKSHHSFPNSMIIYLRDDLILLLMVTDRCMKLSSPTKTEHWFRHGGGVVLLRHRQRIGEFRSGSVQTVTNVTKCNHLH